jgi:hypothetical protein
VGHSRNHGLRKRSRHSKHLSLVHSFAKFGLWNAELSVGSEARYKREMLPTSTLGVDLTARVLANLASSLFQGGQ